MKAFITKVFGKHAAYASSVFYVCLAISYLFALFDWGRTLLISLLEGNFLAFAVLLVLQTIILSISGLIGAIILSVIAIPVLFIPYLIVRGFMRS